MRHGRGEAIVASSLSPNGRSTLGRSVAGTGLKWLAQGSAAGLLFVWAAFFIAHVDEWFVTPAGYPPAWVWAAMVAHFAIIVGMALLLWSDRAGAVLIVVATAAFIALTGFEWGIIALVAPANLLPVACVAASRLINRSRPKSAMN